MSWLNCSMRLGADTKKIKTKTGTPMTTGFGFMDVNAESGYPIAVVSFGEIATELAKYKKVFTNRLAFLGPEDPDRMHRAEFFKAAMDALGIKLEMFTDHEAAIEWLSDVTTHDLESEE